MSSQPRPDWSPELQQRHLRWNYAAFVADGAAYMAGMAFVSEQSVMPNMIRSLGGADWLVALSPSFQLVGTLVTPMLVVHKVEQLRSYRPFSFRISIFQRLVPLIAAVLLLWGWDYVPSLAMWFASLSFLILGAIGGFGTSSFWELYSKILPANRRSSNNGWRNCLGLLVGIGAGWIVGRVLAQYPGRVGYGLLFMLMFAGVAISGVFFFLIREYPNPPREERPRRSMWGFFSTIPKTLRTEPAFMRFAIMRALGQAHVIVVPFLALHFREVLGQPEAFLGALVQAQMIGGLLGGLGAGYWGDRSGCRAPLMVSRLLALLLCACACLVASPFAAIACFFALGVVLNINNVAEYTFILELAPPDKRPAMIALQSVLLVPASIGFGFLSTWLYSSGASLLLPGSVAALMIGASFLLLLRIKEPRHAVT